MKIVDRNKRKRIFLLDVFILLFSIDFFREIFEDEDLRRYLRQISSEERHDE